MRILILEYVTAGGWREIGAGPSLLAEGAMMLQALARDLAELPGVEVVAAQDREAAPPLTAGTVVAVAPDDLWGSWRRLAIDCDAVWPIAPETDGLLEEVTRLAQSAGAAVLNSRGPALSIARSKRATAAHLAAAGIPVIPTIPLGAPSMPSRDGWVVKPDDGAGAVDTVRLTDRAAFERYCSSEAPSGTVVQPFIPGEPLSLSLLAQEGHAWLLSCNRQDVVLVEDRFHYRGGEVGGAEGRRAALEPLAKSVASALPDLWGYVGIDVIDGQGGPMVIEVNPRLTTSYVGLRDSIGINPAGLVLALRERRLEDLIRPLAPRSVPVRVPSA